jgi:hypothetical protein
VVSNTVTAYGINAPAAVSITGGEYSVNGGLFTTSAGTVSNRDRVAVRVVASGSPATTTSATLTIGGVAATFDVTTYVPGAPFTAVFIESATPSSFSGISSLFAQAPDWSITASPTQQGHRITIGLVDATHAFYTLDLFGPLDQQLAIGPYEQAYYISEASPVLNFGPWCQGSTSGRFVIHELAFGSSPDTIDSFAASFEEWCTTGEPIFGDIRINSTMPLPAMVTTPRMTPYPFAFSAQSPVRPGTVVESNLTTMDGIDQPVPISIVGGEYSLNGASFTSVPGTANPRDDVRVRTTASQTPGAVQSATFTAGGRSASLSITTYQSGMVLSGLYYRSPPGEAIGGGQSRLLLAPPAGLTVDQPVPTSIAASLSPLGTEGSWSLNLAVPGVGPVTPGMYENAGAWPIQPPTSPGIQFGGGGRGCTPFTGRFVVREAVYAPDGTPQRFAADFEQVCDDNQRDPPDPVYGEIRFNSTVPFSVLLPPTAPVPNLSTRGSVDSGDDIMIGGFIIGGATNKTVAIVGTGPSLAAQGVANALANPTVTVVDAATRTIVAQNDNWGDDPNAAQLQASGFAPSNPLESGLVLNLPPGAYTAVLSGASGSQGIGVVAVNEVDHPESPLVAISTRGPVRSGDDVLIGGFVVQGPGPRTVAIMGTGPSLAAGGVANPLANPMLQLVDNSTHTVIATNDDWGTAPNAAQITASGYAPPDPHESVILITLDPGVYTAVLSGSGGATGVGAVAVYTVQ